MNDNEYNSDNSDDYDSDGDGSDNENVISPVKSELFKPSNNITKVKTYRGGADDEVDYDELSTDEADDDDDDIIDDDDDDIIDDDDDDDVDVDEEEIKDDTLIIDKDIPKKIKQTQLIVQDDDDDDDEDDDENYLQKFDNDIMKNYINEFHPECLNHNYDEITKMSIVVRNSANIIIDPLHRTIPYLTKYERARILGQRAKQIETGAKPLVKIPENIIDSYIIADLELKEKKIPFIIRRPIPGGSCEYWALKDLENIAY
jgi:DNA-directed RNA polymerase I, II, and III subunit RPABC2